MSDLLLTLFYWQYHKNMLWTIVMFASLLQGFDVDFWWRKPAGESLTIQVGNKYFTDFSYFAFYVATPWNSKRGFQQLLVIYQVSYRTEIYYLRTYYFHLN